MDWRLQCAAVIPCFNEASTIADVTRRTLLHVQTVLVINDGSTDPTATAASAAGAEVINHPANLGKGAALRSGWRHAAARGFPWVITLDGDGQHAPEDIPAFFACAERTAAALVIGNRMARPAPMPWLRRLVNRWMSRRLSRAAGLLLPDSQCGFRLINIQQLTALSLTTSHFEIESEVLLAFARATARIEFVPIQVLYKSEHSKIHPLIDTTRWFRWWGQQRNRR